ncbi:class I SAM-dependent methyltransferase [Cohnella luojiensis]|uniref:class I SAM-dependent methyltransferase n=1 Tax=Cohnella luojiensis TaxID=652876 RepID=UPI001F110F53|nr:class I SAM-dependent methyltransferase [Cohnella luojiensis]
MNSVTGDESLWEKWFPKVYDSLMGPLERRGFGQIRKKLIQKAHGEVLEIGSGTGLNFPFYEHANKVTAIEPEPRMRELSLPRAQSAQVPIDVILAEAEKLPFPDDFFDTVVCTLVFCTIPNPTKALEEIRRVCKPEGHILLIEHVKIEHRFLGQLQEWLTPFWKRLCDGCHLNRNTLHLVKLAGFKVTSVNRYYKDIFLVVEAINKKQSFF